MSANDVIVQPVTTTVDVSSGGQTVNIQKVNVTVRPATEQMVVNTTGPNKIIEVGKQGPPGKDGADSPTAGTIEKTYIADEAISLGRCVVILSSGRVRTADSTNQDDRSNVLGVAKTSTGAAGQSLTVIIFGLLQSSVYNFTDFNAPVYLNGTNGQVSQTAPANGFISKIGIATAADEILLRISQPIVRI